MEKGMNKDFSALLPDGSSFTFWEKENTYQTVLYVDSTNKEEIEKQDGSAKHPFATISQAADVACPGTKVRIHAGVYRECVSPKQGGTDPEHMICYEAYGDGEVCIKASEQVTEFERSIGWRIAGDPTQDTPEHVRIYAHELDPDMFRGYNPFCAVNILHDRLFIEYEKTDMTTYLNRRGMVFCDGKPLKQVSLYNMMGAEEGTYWVEHNGQTIHFRLPGDDDPKNHSIEITVREQCFAPKKPFLSYIKVKGITAAHAATGAPVPQRGAISAHRGHHWVIENCVIDWSNCVGIDVGNECWHHDFTEDQLIGHSVIRGCTIKDCGVCGIAGLFATHMLIEDNLVEGTGWQKMELSWEAGGMKLHNSVNGLFRRNIFKNTLRADHIWLDCGNENNRITENLFLDGIEQREAVFIECTREGINLIDRNIFWNVEGRFDPAKIPQEPGSTGWYKMVEHDIENGYAVYGEGTDHLRIVNNLIGKCKNAGYFAKPVAFRTFGIERGGTSVDAALVGNLFYDCGGAMTLPTDANTVEGNIYVKMQGGYLRVMYPAPEVLLHLPAWKEFKGFDLEGQEGWFDIDVDTENYTLKFAPSSTKIPGFPMDIKRRGFIDSVEKVHHISDALYEEKTGISREVLGTCEELKEGILYQIDPRKK
ncbi:MAG: right-handed parallel beta-helix repeat-containing protein [Lachnospiraceae bacterium]|nr:right-handed parallel beta-helix repeat-containing protein [Lachnospiraceae bacterium]